MTRVCFLSQLTQGLTQHIRHQSEPSFFEQHLQSPKLTDNPPTLLTSLFTHINLKYAFPCLEKFSNLVLLFKRLPYIRELKIPALQENLCLWCYNLFGIYANNWIMNICNEDYFFTLFLHKRNSILSSCCICI